MHKRLSLSLLGLIMVGMLVLSWGTLAQGTQDPTPMPYTPGVPLVTGTPPTPNPNICLTALPIALNSQIFIKPGVNLRNIPSESGALVWNTIYDNYEEDGNIIESPVNVAVTVVEGPTCAGGFNWWRVVGLEEPGWVAEGRPDRGGYYLIVPGLAGAGGGSECYSLYTLSANSTADLLLNAKVRAEPSLQGLVKTVAPYGTPVTILGDKTCVGGLVWWRVRVTVVGVAYEGWMSESESGDYYLLPKDLPNSADGTLCGTPLNLAIGQEAYVNTRNGSPKSLRSAPGVNAPLLFTLVDNVPIIIEGGTVCRDNLNWWKVRVLASQEVVGWLAEGSAGVGYWISTINPNEFAR
jgi:hypothetical protein